MNIVVHWHHVPSALVDAVGRGQLPGSIVDGVFELHSGDTLPLPATLTDPDEAVAALDSSEVQLACPSLAPPLTHYALPGDDGLRLARIVNDAFAGLQEKYPTRLRPLAQVPLQDPHAAALELRRAVLELGLAGVAIGTNVNGRNLGAAEFRPFWRAVAELDTFVFLHPGPQSPLGGADRLRDPFLTNFVAFPLDTAAAVASLMFEGVYAEFGPLKTCFSHGGGAFPYILSRWEHGYQARVAGRPGAVGSPLSYLESCYCDSLVHGASSLRFLVDTVGADHVMLGNDFPFNMGDPQPVATMRAAIASDVDRELIGGRTAARLLGLDWPLPS